MQSDAKAGCISIRYLSLMSCRIKMNNMTNKSEMNNVQINTKFAAMQMIEVLFAKGMLNEATYSNILSHMKNDDREAA